MPRRILVVNLPLSRRQFMIYDMVSRSMADADLTYFRGAVHPVPSAGSVPGYGIDCIEIQ
jgi:hypothetical protein